MMDNFSYIKHWMYPQLRDTINTSMDIALLDACFSELSRRLDAYRYWKLKNTTLLGHQREGEEDKVKEKEYSKSPEDMYEKHRKMEFEELIQKITTSNNLKEIHACQKELQNKLNSYVSKKESVLTKGKQQSSSGFINNNSQSRSTASHSTYTEIRPSTSGFMNNYSENIPTAPHNTERRPSNIPVHSKRCFKTPLVNEYGILIGCWYGQFDNQKIMKQIETRENQPPVLLRAGYDDKLMCSFPLADTGLELIRGAEITYEDFAKTWNSLGGKPLMFL